MFVDLLGVEALGGPHAVDEALGLPSRVAEPVGPELLLTFDRQAVDGRGLRGLLPQHEIDLALGRVVTPAHTRGFRRTLLMHRDGARLHAGSMPGGADLDRIAHKMQFLLASGLPEEDARMAMLAAGRYTVGSVLEEQADTALAVGADHPVVPTIDNESAFEAGLALMVDGLAQRVGT